ncbi:MAG: DsbC family protein [Deltaproteobacteria bacterium]|nr:DsbC family protein [Deltaproteobacteria bacterium]
MIKRLLFLTVLLAAHVFSTPPSAVSAFQGPGCMGSCADCHSLNKEDATKLLKTDRFKAVVKDIRMSPVKGLWEVEINQGDKTFIVYMDFARKFLIDGKVNFTPLERLGESAPLKKVDLKKIPLDNAVVFGNRNAEKKVIVFDDPDCPYCVKLHQEIKKIIEKRKDIAFYVKMYPLAIHPEAYEKSKAIVCSKSGKLLEDAFAGKKLPKADCDAKELDANIKLAAELEIRGTPALIFPDGRLFPGYAPAETLLGILDNPQ